MFVPGRSKRRGWRWWGVAVILCATGCGTRNTYSVELRLTDEGFMRTVDVASHPRPEPEANAPASPFISDDERKLFSAIYGPGQIGSESERFEGTFSAATPDDVGGSGSLIRWRSELGDTFVYHERFRGKLPTLHDRKLRAATIDQLIRWTSDWLDEELRDVAGAEELKRFVGGELRTDLQDLVCLLEVTAANSPESGSKDEYRSLLLIGHLLAERGYLSFADLAGLPLNDLSETEQQNWVLERFRRKLVKGTGLTTDSAAIQWLNEPEALGRRFLKFLESTPEYRLWRETQLAASAAAPVEPPAFLGHSLEPVTGPLFVGLLTWGGVDELTLVLHTVAEPLETNGQWDAESGSVRWQTPLPHRSVLPQEASWIYSGLPRVVFAQWVQADRSRQMTLFGQVLVRDAMLRDYCLWRQRLGEPQAARWQTLLEQLPDVAAEQRVAKLTEFKQQWSDEFDATPSFLDTLIKGLAAPSEN